MEALKYKIPRSNLEGFLIAYGVKCPRYNAEEMPSGSIACQQLEELKLACKNGGIELAVSLLPIPNWILESRPKREMHFRNLVDVDLPEIEKFHIAIWNAGLKCSLYVISARWIFLKDTPWRLAIKCPGSWL